MSAFLIVLISSVLAFESGQPAAGRRAFIALQCNACHRVAEDPALPVVKDAPQGPVLNHLGKQTPEAVANRIVSRTSLDPESLYDEPMTDSASAMTERQLIDIVAYLRDPAAATRKESP